MYIYRCIDLNVCVCVYTGWYDLGVVLKLAMDTRCRITKVLEKLDSLLKDFQLSNDVDADVVDGVEAIRAKFRQLSSLTSKGQQGFHNMDTNRQQGISF